MKTKRRSKLLYVVLCVIGLAMRVVAQTSITSTNEPVLGDTNQPPSAGELAKLKQNPVSGLRQIGIQASVNPDLPGSGKTAGNYSLQPVWPFPLGDDFRLITYTILPLIQQPAVNGGSAKVGLGDTLINLYVAPKSPSAFVWGVGPAIVLPTRTDPALGSDQAGLGPAAVLFYAQEKWSVGVVLQNVWSLGGSDDNVFNGFGAQYLFNYNLPKAWFLYSNATITSNWRADDNDRWTIPVGGGFGRVFNIGKQPVSLSLQAFSNVIRPDGSATWTGVVQFSLLFP